MLDRHRRVSDAPLLGLSLGIGAPGSHVPHESLCQARAAELPVTVQPINRLLLDLIPGCQIGLVLMTVGCLSTEHPRFTFVRLPGTYLTSLLAFSRSVHHLGAYPHAAPGGLRADPATRPRRACLHLPCSKAAAFGLHSYLLLLPSWHTLPTHR